MVGVKCLSISYEVGTGGRCHGLVSGVKAVLRAEFGVKAGIRDADRSQYWGLKLCQD